jgi:hypothetical protein
LSSVGQTAKQGEAACTHIHSALKKKKKKKPQQTEVTGGISMQAKEP